jgi:hypothetical protein
MQKSTSKGEVSGNHVHYTGYCDPNAMHNPLRRKECDVTTYVVGEVDYYSRSVAATAVSGFTSCSVAHRGMFCEAFFASKRDGGALRMEGNEF